MPGIKIKMLEVKDLKTLPEIKNRQIQCKIDQNQNLVLCLVGKHSYFKAKLTSIQPNCYYQANENIRDFYAN